MRCASGLLLVALACACARPASPWERVGVRVVDGRPQLDEVEIELTRTTCFGTCPAYSVKLSGSGQLTYTGLSFVKTKGEHTAQIDPQALLPLLQCFQDLDFLGAEHHCFTNVVDNSHAELKLSIGSRSRAVEDEICSRGIDELNTAPAGESSWHRKAADLEDAIDTFAHIDSWIGTAVERGAHSADWR
jgi:Domain of unknown function (DUF6438)